MSQPGQTTKSKELKTITKQVISPGVINEDKRKLKLLYIINIFGGVTERALISFLYEASQKGLNMDYTFNVIGNNIFSPSVKEDITSLLYLGLIESEPIAKKLKVSANGMEILEANQNNIEEEFKKQLNQVLEELKAKITAIDEEQSLKLKSERRRNYYRR
ncbi:hypothetical protein CM19_08850 [Candidatus Acidianus copahuensis]|uniref:Uncharacterized protein n=1 Tax=Candidatus Acidianus copahuensis TaxID=1160895 RepID=A0A031LKF7_9CREN|nr:hypothetical protein [Candidatus Acidianus copahuensis]EZQ03823.1 hypothetical protein CM19_08850 [Candidatus Acidianus copahuensis]